MQVAQDFAISLVCLTEIRVYKHKLTMYTACVQYQTCTKLVGERVWLHKTNIKRYQR